MGKFVICMSTTLWRFSYRRVNNMLEREVTLEKRFLTRIVLTVFLQCGERSEELTKRTAYDNISAGVPST
jgi:hypothetical protein